MTAINDDTAITQTVNSAGDELSAEQVGEYLRRHPALFADHPELLESLMVPSRWSGGGVVDLQQAMLERLRGEIDCLRDCAQDVIETCRVNLGNQTRVHDAVLALLAATDFDRMVRIVIDDLPLLLGVDVVAIGFEPEHPSAIGLISPDIRRFDAGTVDRLLGNGQKVLLRRQMNDDGTIFGTASGLACSAALARLRSGPATPEGLLAMGSRESAFHPGQGTELIAFLARVVELRIHEWRGKPA
ncbi:MAG: DUF484 family protein [Rhodospirillales bacterium]|jgi:hypothetical protein|nr:DUF484 family protein [Rhodospirillales bacterium]MDP7098494.1 DUF484 family protein [Rhodospirillales bacterium]MDP7214877.1 DUF484 family protein [Rhodospirillales bacterium]HIJ93104.1 DUF484 family protein [Rhodospirillaceae bacterium]HJP53319.1 DUF484 family protein [Rhodospirillales bacterium]